MARENEKRSLDLPKEDGRPLPVGKSWFFGIGINTYPHPIPSLFNARKDIEDILQLLQERYELDEALTLFDEAATRGAIMDHLQLLDEKVGGNDKLIIYYSGHGHLDAKERGYWIPADAEERRISSYLHNTTLREFIAGIEARHTLLISDSCFSGALTRDAGNAQAALEELERDRSRWVISSGRQREKVADGKPGKNSPFAASILKVLGQNQEAGINVSLLFDRVQKQTRFNYEQLPQSAALYGAGHEGGQYVFRLRTGEETIWEDATKAPSLRAYNRYLDQFPHGKYADEAMAHIQDLEDEQEWKKTERLDRIYAYQKYLRSFPNAINAKAARQRIAELEEEDTSPAQKMVDARPITTPPKELLTPKSNPNTFTDPRDGQVYRTVELKGLRWMAQNLNFDVGEGCWIYKNLPENAKIYGRLYTWEAAKKACPPGWRLPRDEEWRALAMAHGGLWDGDDQGDPKKAYAELMEGGSSGFSALLGGSRSTDGSFSSLGDVGRYWSATEYGVGEAWDYYFSRRSSKLYRSILSKEFGFSCRCVQD